MEFLAHLLLPRHTNNHKARIIQPIGVIVLTLIFISVQLALNSYTRIQGSVLGYAANISVDEVIKLTNQKRAENGLPPLKMNADLSTAAHAKGEDMLKKGYWAHVAPDGTTPWKFFNDIAYKYRYAGENLARDFSSATAAVDAWMASPSHRENMLSPKYKEIGIGVVEGDLGGVDTTIVVQFFGSTLADTIPTQPVVQAKEQQPSPLPAASPLVAIKSLGVKNAQSGTVLISPFLTTRGFSTALIILLLCVFVVDVLVISRRRITRISSKSIAHISFLGMILAIVVIIEAGRIL
jgi:uncharacterized protein YkwD